MKQLPELPGVPGLYGTKPELGTDAPSPVDWWAAANAAAVTVQIMDFATGFLSVVTLPATGLATRLYPQGMAVREPNIANLSAVAFDIGFRANLGYNDGGPAIRVPAGMVWTKYGIFANPAVAAIAGVIEVPSGAMDNANAGQDTNSRTLGWDNVAAVWARIRTTSAAVLALLSSVGGLLVAGPGEWGVSHVPAVAVQATTNRPAVAATRHVAKSITVSLVAGLAVTGVNTFVLRDGATGVGPILWQISLGAVASDSKQIAIPVNLPGSLNTAMTLESLAAPNATTFVTVSLTGYDAA